MGVHLLKGLDLRMTEMTFAVFYQGAHLLSTAAGKYSASSRTAPTPGFRAQSIANGQRVSEISQVPAGQKPTSNRTLHSHDNSNFARYQFHSDSHSGVPSFSRTPPSVHLQLGTDHCRPVDPGMCKGISPGVGLPSITEVFPHGLWNKGPVGNQGGGEELDDQAGNPGGRATEGSICKPAIYCAKKGWFSPTSGKPQTSEQLHHEETLQDGRGSFTKEPGATKRLDGIHRFERCLPVSRGCRGTQEVPEVPVGAPAVRVSLSPFRPQQCPTHFHETAQASDVINKTARSQVDSFPGRYVIDGRVQGEASEAGARDCTASSATGLCGQLRKVSTQPNTENSVFGVRDRLSQDEDQPTKGEGGKDQTGMSVGTAAKVSLNTRPHSIDRKVDSDNAGSSTCTSPLPESPENKEPSTQTISGFQHSRDFEPECKRGANLVAEQPGELEWKGNVGANTRYDSGDRHIPAWMGCSFGRGANGRPVVRRRTNASYQPAGVDSRCVCSQNLCSPQEKHSHAPQNGQQDSHILHQQDGWNSITSPCPYSLPAVAVVPPAGDYIVSRTSAGVQQHHSRPRVSASSLVSRVDAQQGDIQLDNGGPGPMSIGSVCNLTQPPVESVFELEARPVRNGDRCLLHQLEGQRRICFPTICTNREMSPESTRRESNSCFSSTNMDCSSVVPRPSGAFDQRPTTPSQEKGLAHRPIQQMEDLQLAAWKVSGNSTMIWEYQRGLPSSPRLDGVQAQTRLISQPGKDGVAGVLNGKLIPFHVEFNPS